MTALWAAAAGTDMLGPYAANAADMEHICARYAVPILQLYMEYCLVQGTFTPRTFWTDVIGQVLLDNCVADCAVLVNWAWVVSTYGPVDQAGNPRIPLAAVNHLRVPPSRRRVETGRVEVDHIGYSKVGTASHSTQGTVPAAKPSA